MPLQNGYRGIEEKNHPNYDKKKKHVSSTL
jgi:hypothetical protein